MKDEKPGLTKEDILDIIKDESFQKSLKIFSTPTSHNLIKAIGFSIAVAAGIFGYYLKADSEADDRKAQAIHRTIDEKKEWMVKTLNAGLDLRKIRLLIELDCKFQKPIPSYEQATKRLFARDNLIKAFSGITEVYNQEVFDSFVQFIKFDESVKDVCAKEAPNDEAWKNFQTKSTLLMRDSIKKDRDELKKLGNSLFNRI